MENAMYIDFLYNSLVVHMTEHEHLSVLLAGLLHSLHISALCDV